MKNSFIFLIFCAGLLLGCSGGDTTQPPTVFVFGRVIDVTTITLPGDTTLHKVLFIGDNDTGKWWCISRNTNKPWVIGDLFVDTIFWDRVFYADTFGLETPAMELKIKPNPLHEVGEEKIPKWDK